MFRHKPIIYISKNGKDVKALLYNTIQLSKEKGIFVGEDEKYDSYTGNYDKYAISVKINSLGVFRKKKILAGWKEVIPEVFFNGLRYVRRELVELLSDEEKLALKRISTTQIINIIKKMDKNANKWSAFENAVYMIHDRTIRYFREVRRPIYKEVKTGFVENADIIVNYKGKEYKLTRGTYVSKADCSGEKQYRFVVNCAR